MRLGYYLYSYRCLCCSSYLSYLQGALGLNPDHILLLNGCIYPDPRSSLGTKELKLKTIEQKTETEIN